MTREQGLWCVVPAAGSGQRFGSAIPKQHVLLRGWPVLWHTLQRLAAHPRVAGIVLVLASGDSMADTLPAMSKPVLRAVGGSTRARSVLAGLAALPDSVDPHDFVLVHDAARPCIREEDISRLIDEACDGEGGLLATPLADTLKRSDGAGRVEATVPRAGLWRALTPQVFRRGALQSALQAADAERIVVTDEAMAMERMGVAPRLVEGRADNIKITHPADLRLADLLLEDTP